MGFTGGRKDDLVFPPLSKNFPQFVVLYTVKRFSLVNEAKVEVFLELCSFFCDPVDVGHLISAKEYSNYCTIVLISHASKIILKFSKARLQQYVN